MSLIVRITVRLAVVALIALAGTILWMLHATDARLQRGAEISVDRLERHWMYRPGLGSLGVTSSELLSGWTARASGSVVLPGVCIVVSTPTDPDSSLCNARDGLGGTVPAWFAALFERFAAPREEDKKAPYSLVTFGGGPRICIGVNFAQVEIKALAAHVLRRFDLDVLPGQEIRQIYAPTIGAPTDGIRVRVTARD